MSNKIFMWLAAAGCVLLLMMCAAVQAETVEGLVAYYPLEGKALDVSGNGHDGSAIGGVSYGPGHSGAGSQAAVFDGQDGYISIPASPEILNIRHYTLAFWSRIYSYSMDESHYTPLISKWYSDGSSSGAWNVQLNRIDGIISMFHSYDGGYSIYGGVEFYYVPFLPPVSAWTHLVLVYDNPEDPDRVDSHGNYYGDLRLYINGREVRHNTEVLMAFDSDSSITLGRRIYKSAISYLHGSIDDVQIYNRALTPAEIRKIGGFSNYFINRQVISSTGSIIAAADESYTLRFCLGHPTPTSPGFLTASTMDTYELTPGFWNAASRTWLSRFDSEPDGDVDGYDLAAFIAALPGNPDLLNQINLLSADFGKISRR